MILTSWRQWRHPLEFTWLLLFILFLPLREAPKHIFEFAYVVTWLVNRIRAHDLGPRWGNWDTLLVAWVASSYLAAAFAGIHRANGNEWSAVSDQVRYVLLLWGLLRGGYSRGEALTLLAALVGSCVIAEIEALWNWRIAHTRPALELTSVGQVNHSAIYITICLGIAAGLVLAFWHELAPRWRGALVGAGLLMLAGLLATGGRAASAMSILLLLILASVAARTLGLGRAVWAGALLVIAIAALAGGTSAIERQVDTVLAHDILTERDLIWNRGLVAWRATPWFGVGPDNYSQITPGILRGELAAEGKPYVESQYAAAPHAHNLYINNLVERGILGLSALLAVLITWGVLLARYVPRPGTEPALLALWCASFSGWLVTMVIGMVNTTLHHEHALLALMTLGLWLPLARQAAKPPP